MKLFASVTLSISLIAALATVTPALASNEDLAVNCSMTVNCPGIVTEKINGVAGNSQARERVAVDIVVALGNEALKRQVNAPECTNLSAGVQAASELINDSARKRQAQKIASSMCSIRRLTTATVLKTSTLSRAASSN